MEQRRLPARKIAFYEARSFSVPAEGVRARQYAATPGRIGPSLYISFPGNDAAVTRPEEEFDHMVSAMRSEVPSCPYCVSGTVFREMKVLGNGRHTCEECGHIVFPGDSVFWCPCPKCLEGRFSPIMRDSRG